MKITLFSQWDCKTCVALKEKLNENKISYKELYEKIQIYSFYLKNDKFI